MRKQLQAEEGLPELEATLAELLEKKKAAEPLVLAPKAKGNFISFPERNDSFSNVLKKI